MHLLCGDGGGRRPAQTGTKPLAAKRSGAGELAALKAEQTRLAAELDALRSLVQRIAADLGIEPGALSRRTAEFATTGGASSQNVSLCAMRPRCDSKFPMRRSSCTK